MAYIGKQPATGENNSFKILDDISSYVFTFNPQSSAIVDTSANTITHNDHRFVQGQRIKYNNGGGSNIGGLTDNAFYYVGSLKSKLAFMKSFLENHGKAL